jgi:DHA1 family bicyclomycin/chloramphenicol resistance-like MFS transporter
MPIVGLIFSNFNALAMEPQQHVAGIASSIVGAVTILIGAGGGYLVGQAFDGTLVPLTVGYSAFGLITVMILLVTERGRLMQPTPGRSEENPT